jgi:transposase
MKFFLGLDIAKDSFVAVLLDTDGRVVQQRTFANAPAGFAELLEWLPDPHATLALCEPTGVYGKRIHQALATALGSLHEINAHSLRRFSFSQVQTKTDQADAMAIAHAARTLFLTRPDLLDKSRVICDAGRDILALWLSEYDRLRAAIVALRNQIAGLAYHTASDAQAVRERRQTELDMLLRHRKEVLDQIVAIYRQLDDRQAELIDSIPGLGPLATAATLAVVRNVDRFDSCDALKGYLGTYPARRQSGSWEAAAHLAQHGNRLLRHILWNCAKAAVWHKHPRNPFKLLFDRLRAKGKSYAAAIGAVVRKLVQTIYGVLKTQTPFRYPTS